MAEDPFATADLRARVLHAWAASPARFREDANAEDDLVRGGYRDRVVVELAQNAADAATRAGVPGRLVLALDGDLLVASNTGAPLDAAGVESLSTLRASTKRDDDGGRTAGRFGVGFAAVLAVTDAPRIVSTTGSVRWDAVRAHGEVAGIDGLRAELERRAGQVPVLRLPYPWTQRPDEGATTVVELPLRDAPALDLVRRLLGEVDDALLLALPSLERIEVEVDGVRRVVADEGRWQVVRRAGRSDPQLLADRPVEERDRPSWSVTWARPLAGQPIPPVLHAPTPTDEPLDLPALLIGSFPLDTARRHVAPGPLTDFLVEQAAAAYVDLLSGVLGVEEPGDRLALVPGPVPAGRLDGMLRSAVVEALAVAPVLRTRGGSPVAPRDAVSVVGADEGVLRALDGVVEGLVPDSVVLDRLGARRLQLVDAVDLLADLDRPPAWWHDLYAALVDGGPVDSEALGALPVPLADGRLVRGARGALLPGDGLEIDTPALGALGLRLVHPEAAHPLLLRLGAALATARTVLERPEVRQAVEGEREDPVGLAAAVLALVEAAGLRPGELAWLAGLSLTDDAGHQAPADELVLPGSVLAGLAEPGALGAVASALSERWGTDVLAAVGVLVDLTVAECHDLSLDPAAGDDDVDGAALPALAEWVEWAADQVGPTDLPASVRVLRGVRELDVVADDAWERLLARVADDQGLRSALLDPVAVDLDGGGRVLIPSYTAWWLRTRSLLQGRPPGEWSVEGADGLAGLYDVMAAPPGVDPVVLRAAGVRVSLSAVLGEPGGADELLDRLAEPGREVPAETLSMLYGALALVDPQDVTPPDRVRVRSGDVVEVVDAADVVVVDAPHHLQLLWATPPLVVPLSEAAGLAQVLDVELSSQRVGAPVLGGEKRVMPAAVRRVLAAAPEHWWEDEAITVDGTDVAWWVTDEGEVHAATVDGLARGLAWVAGRWDARLVVAAVLDARDDVARVDELVAETLLDGR